MTAFRIEETSCNIPKTIEFKGIIGGVKKKDRSLFTRLARESDARLDQKFHPLAASQHSVIEMPEFLRYPSPGWQDEKNSNTRDQGLAL
jgi:hypothetical protein